MPLSIKPKIIIFFITYKCNARCIMCHAWQKQAYSNDLSLKEIEKIFSNKLISSNLEIINLTGGEPTLRSDLSDIVKILLKYCHRLKRIDIPSNGINTQQVLDQIEKIIALLLPTDVKLSVTVSLDGVGHIHEAIRGIPDMFKNVDQTIQGLKELQSLYPHLSLGLNTVISKINYQHLHENRDYALKNNLGLNFTLATISEIGVESIEMRDRFKMREDERGELIPFFKKLFDNKEIELIYGKFIINILRTGRRNNGCNFRRGKAILLEPNGNAYMCGNFKEFKLGNLSREETAEVFKNNRKFSNNVWRRCLKCESNCYLE